MNRLHFLPKAFVKMQDEDILKKGRECLSLEAEAIRHTAEALDGAFVRCIQRIRDCMLRQGKLVFSGVGKNAPVCEKLVGTFNSTGVPAVFLNPVQALHGDLGLCGSGDLAFLLSNSGTTEELVNLVPLLKRLDVTVVAVTSHPGSKLSSVCDDELDFKCEREACPLNLAPTASTTAALALGDALAMVFLDMRGFTREDFARFHPSGNLGKSLLLRVSEVMRSGERMARLPNTCCVREAVLEITQARCGTIALTDPADGTLSGVFSDGDFRRASLKYPDVLDRLVSEFMTRAPKTIGENALAVDALRVFEKSRVNDLVVIDAEGRPVGLIDGQDLPSLRLV